MNRNELLRSLRAELTAAGLDAREAAIEAREALCTLLRIDHTQLLLHPEVPVPQDAEAALRTVVQHRAAGEPLAYLLGERSFMGMDFIVRPGVLIPRQETELLTEQAAAVIQAEGLRRVLDICTGSGCIGVSLAKLTEAEITLSDISPVAIQTAAENAARQGVRVQVIQSDLFEKIEGQFDLITANPPYITAEAYAALDAVVREHEPALALKGGADGLIFYRRIASEALPHLKAGGYLVQEIGYDQGSAVSEILRQQGYTDIRVAQDYAGLDRIVWARKG